MADINLTARATANRCISVVKKPAHNDQATYPASEAITAGAPIRLNTTTGRWANANATSKACKRRSCEMAATESFIISNWPVTTEMSYKNTAATTIQAIFNPKAAPNTKLIKDIATGMVKTVTASTMAMPAQIIAAHCGAIPRTANK